MNDVTIAQQQNKSNRFLLRPPPWAKSKNVNTFFQEYLQNFKNSFIPDYRTRIEFSVRPAYLVKTMSCDFLKELWKEILLYFKKSRFK